MSTVIELPTADRDYGQLLQDELAEQAVLGSMMMSPAAITDVQGLLLSDDFYRPAHQNIYAAIMAVHGRGELADAILVAKELGRRKLLRRVGGAPYLHTLIEMVPTATNANSYAEMVAEKALLRRLVETGTRLTQYGYAGADGSDVAEVLNLVQAEVQTLMDSRRQVGEPPVDSWAPINLEPWLSGDLQPPEPTLGISRTDGLRLLYEGREHAVLGETESGKTWFAAGCVAAELLAGNHVVYIHYEESDPASTLERLRLLDVDPTVLLARLHFYGPDKPPLPQHVNAMLTPTPTLVIHDGVNEAMSMMGAEIKEAEGASSFRRQLITPFRRMGAAVLVCDHLPLAHDPSRRDAFGSVHKGNALDGARIMLTNTEPFGRNMRGSSKVMVTKDRPGQLRANGEATQHPGITFMGQLVIDDAVNGPDFMMRFYAPRAGAAADADPVNELAELAELIYVVVASLPDQTVSSLEMLYSHVRAAKIQAREKNIKQAATDLVRDNRFVEVSGKRGASGFRAVGPPPEESDE